MRRVQAAVLAAVMTATLVWAPRPPVAEAALPVCPWGNNSFQQCSVDGWDRERGSIALLGDSVMLGSANGMSNPGLPTMLAQDGWGPVAFTATLGMRTRNDRNVNLSGWHWIDRWQRSGFWPSVVAVNLGGNHLSDCTLADTTRCRLRILELLDKIGPGTVVWWSKFTYYPFGGPPGPGMLGWNQALDEVAATRPNLVVWDWPTALATADPPIAMDTNRVHPRSGVEYVKRSRLMAAHLDREVGRARQATARVAVPPPATTGGLGFVPHPGGTPPLAQVDTAAQSTFAVAVPPPPTGTARAAALTVSVQPLAGLGFVTVYPCDQPRTLVSNGNYNDLAWGTVQAVVRVPTDGQVCIFTLTPARVAVDVQGWFVEGDGLRLTPQDPFRLLDTRETGRASTYELRLPGASAAALNVVATEQTTPVAFTFSDCSGRRPLAQSSAPAGATVASALYVPVGPDGRVCIDAPTTGDLVVDLTGVFSPSGQLAFTPAVVTRLLDTRDGTGGWIGRHARGQTIDVLAAPPGARAVTGTLTMVTPFGPGWERANPCDAPVSTASAINTVPFAVAANSITVGLSADQRLCLYAFVGTHTLFDVAGWWAP